MIIDDVNLSTLGLTVQRRGSSLSAPRVRHIMAGRPGAQRQLRIGQEAPEARLLTLTGILEADSVANLQAAYDELKHRTRPTKNLTVAWSDRTGVEYTGRRESLEPDEFHPAWLQTVLAVELAILCDDPRGKETSLQNKSTNGAAPLILTPDVGTAVMPVIITITGSSSNLVDPVVQYRDGSDTVLYSFTYSGTLTGSDTLVVDSEAFTVELNGSDAGGNLSGTIFDVDPGDGDPYAGTPTYPDIRLTATSGSADLFKVEYYRRYQ